MKTEIFDGRAEAKKIETFLLENDKVAEKSLVIIQCDGTDTESEYVSLKRKMGERLGVVVEVRIIQDEEELRDEIVRINKDEMVDGLIVQLPILDLDKNQTDEILRTISVEKDVDGLNPESNFLPAVVRATEMVMDVAEVTTGELIGVVGAEGMVGKRLSDYLEKIGYKVRRFDVEDDLYELYECDVVISAVGKAGLIKKEMGKEGFVGIDLGYPQADIELGAGNKARFMTPVPGGVGPMTIVSLYQNLAEVEMR